MDDEWDLSELVLDEVSLVIAGDNIGAHVVLAKTAPEVVSKVPSRAYPDLERKPGKQNWVDHAGGLPSYIERIAKHLHYEGGMTIGHAIATAVNQCKKWAAGGDNVNPDTKAKAAKAIAEWEAKKVKGSAAMRAKKDWFTASNLSVALGVDLAVIKALSVNEYAMVCKAITG